VNPQLYKHAGYETQPVTPEPTVPNAAGWATSHAEPSAESQQAEPNGDDDGNEDDYEAAAAAGIYIIHRGAFLNDYLKQRTPHQRRLLARHFDFAQEKQLGVLFGVLSYPCRRRLNDAAHNPTLADLVDMLQYLEDIGYDAAAAELQWSVGGAERVAVFVSAMKHLLSPWTNPNHRPVPCNSNKDLPFPLQVLRYGRQESTMESRC